MEIKYLGHSCFLMTIGDKKIITDPFIRGNALAANKVDVDQLIVDYILLSHGHMDHVADAEELSLRNGAPIISVVEVCNWFADRACQTHELNIGGSHTFSFGKVKLVNAIHSSSMPDGSYGGQPSGMLIYAEGKIIYFAGDTALTLDMQLIPKHMGKPDIAILPIGDNYTMGYADAAIAAHYLEAKTIIACHFDTFPAIQIRRSEVMEYFINAGLDLIIPEINQEIIV